MGDPSLPDGCSQSDIEHHYDDGYLGSCPHCYGDLFVADLAGHVGQCDTCRVLVDMEPDVEPQEPDDVDNSGYGYDPFG